MASSPRTPTAFAAALLLAGAASAAPVPEAFIEVTADRPDRLPAASPYAAGALAEQAATLPGVRLARQGFGASQADLRIRGAPFQAAGFAVEGLPLVNPQTEHFHADLAIPPLWTPAPALLTGVDQFRAFSGHAAGTLAVELAAPEEHRAGDLTAGPNGLLAASGSAGWRRETADAGTWGGHVALAHDRIDRTDGYSDNALARWRGSALLQGTDAARTVRATLLGTHAVRRFGARGFYGTSSHFPAEEALAETLLLGSLQTRDPDHPGRVTAAWQRTDDRYWLDRHDQDLYANRTRSVFYALHADAAARIAPQSRLWMRLDAAEERINGRYAGRLPGAGLGDHARRRLAVALVPEWTLADVVVSAGGSGAWFDGDKPAWLPAVQIAWKPAPFHTLYAALSGAVRQPSFTELAYDSPGSLGNRDLARQESTRGEAGWRREEAGLRLGAVLFTDQARRVVDWIQTAPDARWTAVNLGRVQTWGMTASASRTLDDRWSLHGAYTVLDKQTEESVRASRYALDYARHELRAGIRLAPFPNWQIDLWQTFGRYASNPARRSGATERESNLELRYRLSRYGLMLAAGVANGWDCDFETLPGHPVSGRQVYLSASIAR